MVLVFASQNENKIREIHGILGNSFKIMGLKDLDIVDDIPETQDTIEGNALQKARYVHDMTGSNVFADDTGLEVEALDGLPGVHSARFAGEDKNSDANIDKLLKMLEGKDNRKARFKTVIALIYHNEEYLFEGIVDGSIIFERKGTEGFGYDSVFVPDGSPVTFAQMSFEEKNNMSHRARAFEKLRSFLKDKSD